jgi:hypothetical protein
MAFTITEVIPLAVDMLKLTFSSKLLTGPEFYNVNNYEIYYGSDAYVGQKLTPKVILNNNKQAADTECIICVPGLVPGAIYTVVVKPLPQNNGLTNSADVVAGVLSTTTKLDSLLMLIPSIYDKGYTSNVRQLMLALASQMDDIGGPEKEYYV